MRGLKGKSAIVTGGSRGIGQAIVKRLLEEEVQVLFTGRKAKTGEALLEELKKNYKTPVYFLAGDMAQEEFCEKTVKTAVEKFGGLDYLVNNAFAFTAKWIDATRDDWYHIMEAGPFAYAAMIKNYVKYRGMTTPGAIVNMSSISAHIAQRKRWTYNTAKGGVHLLTKCAAMDLAPHIRVNSISPAVIYTEECYLDKDGNVARQPDFEGWRPFHMIDRVIFPEEVASATAFLLSDEASAITATDLPVDAGYLSMGVEGWKCDPEYLSSY